MKLEGVKFDTARKTCVKAGVFRATYGGSGHVGMAQKHEKIYNKNKIIRKF